MSLSDEDRIARSRFFALTMMRLAGVMLLMFGLLVWQGDVVRDGGWPALGIPLFAIGLLETILLPKFIASKWRTPKDQ